MSMPKLLTPRKRWLFISLAGIASVWALVPPTGKELTVPDVRASRSIASVAATESVGLPGELPKRQPIGRTGVDLFAPRSLAPPPPLRVEPPEEPPRPSAPPLPYRIAGSIRYDNTVRVLLAAGDRVYEASVGEPLDGVYRVQAATPDAVTLVYTPLGIEQHLAYAPGTSGQAGTVQPNLQSPPARAIAENLPLPATHQRSHAPSPFPPGSPLARR